MVLSSPGGLRSSGERMSCFSRPWPVATCLSDRLSTMFPKDSRGLCDRAPRTPLSLSWACLVTF